MFLFAFNFCQLDFPSKACLQIGKQYFGDVLANTRFEDFLRLVVIFVDLVHLTKYTVWSTT